MKFTGWQGNQQIALDIPEVMATQVAHLKRNGGVIDIWFADNKFYRQIEVAAISRQVEIKPTDKTELWAVTRHYGNLVFLEQYESEPFFVKGVIGSDRVVTQVRRLVDYKDTKAIPEGILAEQNEWAIPKYFSFNALKRVEENEKATIMYSTAFMQTTLYTGDDSVYTLLCDRFGAAHVNKLRDLIVVNRHRLEIPTSDIVEFLEEQSYTLEKK